MTCATVISISDTAECPIDAEDTTISIHDNELAGSADESADAPHDDIVVGARPLLPRDDPFHRPPEGFEDTAPGTILRSRDVDVAFVGLIPQRITAVQLVYRSTDMNGEPMAAVTTVLLPPDRVPGAVCPIVSYQCAIDAITSRCFPSYALRRGSSAIGALPQVEFLVIAALVAEGWVVSVPDHEGPRGLWGLPREPGYCVLDGIRAALDFAPIHLAADSPVGMWGYSGGGLATAWAAETYADYAPELNVVGAVLGSPVGDLGATYRRLNGGFFSGLPALVVGALTQVYPELNRIIADHATARGKAKLVALQRMTTAEAVVRFMFTDMDALLDRPLDEILALPEVRRIFDSIRLGQAVPTMPLLIVQAVNDRIMSVDDIDELARVYSAGGASVTYHRDRFSEHMLLHPMSAPMALRWLRDRFDGRPVSDHHLRTTWPTLLNPSTYRGMLRLAGISAKVLTGRSITRRPLSEFDR